MDKHLFAIFVLLNECFACITHGGGFGNEKVPVNFHPLDPLTSSEITRTSQIIRRDVINPDTYIFNSIGLFEPPKYLLQKSFLNDERPPKLNRVSKVVLIQKGSGKVYEALVDLTTEQIIHSVQLPEGTWPIFTEYDSRNMERIVRENSEVQKRCLQLGYSNMSLVFAEVWGVGYIGDRPELQNKRIAQLFLWASNFPGDNFYAHPLPFVTIVDVVAERVLVIEDLPVHDQFSVQNNGEGMTKIQGSSNYHEEYKPPDFLRKVNPVQISSPEGPNYNVQGYQLTWQKFKMRLGFTIREGLVLHHISYKDGQFVRPLIYRASVTDTVAPYGDPRPPFHRKSAFDEVELGLGLCTNSLRTQADCLGAVHFVDGVYNNENGEPVTTKNAICVHEEDAGVLWKHTEWRNRKVRLARSTRLSISFIVTIANYEFVFSWYFYQDASIQFQVQASGIVATDFLAEGSKPYSHGTQVFPRVSAAFHQHFFMVRMDVDVDGLNNTVSFVDVIPGDKTESPTNPYGQAIFVNRTELKTVSEGCTHTSPLTSRTWRIANKNKTHPYTHNPVEYKLIPMNGPRLIMNSDSPLRKRASFANYDVWVTPYNASQCYAGGDYWNGTETISDWVRDDGQSSIDNMDVVLWHLVGLTHIPRPEDFPVMPVESTGFFLKPMGFFRENPALDVPPPKRGRAEL